MITALRGQSRNLPMTRATSESIQACIRAFLQDPRTRGKVANSMEIQQSCFVTFVTFVRDESFYSFGFEIMEALPMAVVAVRRPRDFPEAKTR